MKKTYIIILTFFFYLNSSAQTVTKFAGTGYAGGVISSPYTFSTGRLYAPANLIIDTFARMWINEFLGNRVRLVDNINAPTQLTPRVGSITSQSGSIDGNGVAARFYGPSGIVMDATGTIYIADAQNHCIRTVSAFINSSTQQTTSTFAGTSGLNGYYDATGINAMFDTPTDLAIDTAKNIYVADLFNHCIRRITPAGVVTTIVGSPNPGNVDSVGALASFLYPIGLGWFSKTELLVADSGNANIRKVNIKTLRVTTVAGNGNKGSADGNAFTSTFWEPTDIAIDTFKNIYVTDQQANTIRKISGTCVTTYAGSATAAPDSTSGIGTAARFNQPMGIVFNNNNLYVADYGNNSIRKITVPYVAPDPIPVALLGSYSSNGNLTTVFTFKDSTVTVPVLSRKWSFSKPVTYQTGDSTSQTISVKFNSLGLDTVTLTVSNCMGNGSKKAVINIFTVGVNEVNNEQQISIFPNPSTGKFEINFNIFKEDWKIRLNDISGRTVLEKKVSSLRETLDMSGFAKGVYLLNISGNEISVNKKLMIE